MELPPDPIIRGLSPHAPTPGNTPPSVLIGPPLTLPTEPHDPEERASALDLASMAPRGSALETVCKEMPESPAAAASRGSAAVCSGNMSFITLT